MRHLFHAFILWNKKHLLRNAIVLSLLVLFIGALYFSAIVQDKKTPVITMEESNPSEYVSKVLGTSNGSLHFSTTGNGFSNGGVLVLSTNKNPEVHIGSYNISGTGKFTLYKVTKEDLLKYLVYKRENTGGVGRVFPIDVNSLQTVSSFEHQVYTADDPEKKAITLPISGTGIWFLKGQVNDDAVETMLVRSNLAAIIHQGDNENIFWVQDNQYRAVDGAHVSILNVENAVSTMVETTTNGEGIATVGTNPAFDIAVVTKDEDVSIIPINLTHLNYRSSGGESHEWGFTQRTSYQKSFIFTDRFLYKPGDTVYFKAIIRTDDDGNYSVSPRPVTVKMGDYNNEFFVKTLSISDVGTVDGVVTIPADAKAGGYSLDIIEGQQHITSTYVQVAQFRKPDAQVSVRSDKLAYLPGETAKITFSGEDFMGQPLRSAHIRYKVYQYKADVAGDYQQLSYIQDAKGFSGGEAPINEGEIQLNEKGTYTLDMRAQNATGYRQYWIVHIEYLDESSVSANDALRMLVQPGNFVIERNTTTQQYVQGEETAFPIKLSKNKSDAIINNVKIKGKLLVYRNSNYVVEKDGLVATTDGEGKASFTITPQEQNSYRLDLEAVDDVGNPIRDDEALYVTLRSNLQQDKQNIFSVTTDKQTYDVGDTAHVTVVTKPEIKHIFTSFGRTYSRGYQVFSLDNGKVSYDIPILESYQPNFYIYVGSFQEDSWATQQNDILVNTGDKKVEVHITPEYTEYGPGETARFDISATNELGQPVKTDMAFWIFDKALLELHEAYYSGIFARFWDHRWANILTHFSFQGIMSSSAEAGGGCFTAQTPVTMADGSTREIQEIKTGDMIRTYASTDSKEYVSAKVAGTHTVNVDGYLIINGQLNITPEHKLLVNGVWKTAGDIQVGDHLLHENGKDIFVRSIEWVRDGKTVYNLYVETYHTFFADGIYVHNEKGEERSVFKDTAYWNPHVTTDENGKASITVKLPDNLTTWAAVAVSANSSTQVGEGKAEFKVKKDVVLRPVLPLFLRSGDIVRLSAYLYNFTPNDEKFSVRAEFTGGDLQNANQEKNVSSNDFEQLFWPLHVNEQGIDGNVHVEAKTMGASSVGDSIVQKIPLYEYGRWITSYQKGEGNTSYAVHMSNETDVSRTQTTLNLSATKYPKLQENLEALTKNGPRVRPSEYIAAASLIKQYGQALGITRLLIPDTSVMQAQADIKASQKSNGVWKTDEYQTIDMNRTRRNIESLVLAKKAGYSIDESILDSARAFFISWNPIQYEERVEKQYIFSLFPEITLDRIKLELNESAEPQIIARAMIANKNNGFTKFSSEESILLSKVHETPTQFAWMVSRSNPSWSDISMPTLWAARALLDSNSEVVRNGKLEKSFDYLWRNSVYDDESQFLMILSTCMYYERTGQFSPDYTYDVFVDNVLKKSGRVTPGSQYIDPIEFDISQIKEGTQVRVEQSGQGKLWSTVELKEFTKDAQYTAKSHDISIVRSYLRPSGEERPTRVGDLVLVQFDIEGLGLGETELVIEDYLPSGLVAIDETLDNGNFDQNGESSSYVAQEITKEGMKLTFSRLFATNGRYTYKTRVISEGTFNAPPATIHHPNEASIWASTNSDQIRIDGKTTLNVVSPGISSFYKSGVTLSSIPTRIIALIGIISLIILLLGGMFMWKKRVFLIQEIRRLRHIRERNIE